MTIMTKTTTDLRLHFRLAIIGNSKTGIKDEKLRRRMETEMILRKYLFDFLVCVEIQNLGGLSHPYKSCILDYEAGGRM